MNQNARHSTMQQVLNQLGNREKEISNMLPQDLPIERFQANVLNALRNTPSILDATAASIVKARSEEHTSELQSLMRISYAVFCLKKKHKHQINNLISTCPIT